MSIVFVKKEKKRKDKMVKDNDVFFFNINF